MIEFRNICKAYGGKSVLKNIDWRVSPRETWLIEGPSGAGKTTLLRLLMGLEQPDSGTLSVTGGLRFDPVFQEDRLVEHWSAAQNVRLAGGREGDALLRALLPENALTQPVRTLSGGMRRRVALARALAAEGDVLALDEPFSGLDAETAAKALSVTFGALRGRALLLVSHGAGEGAPDMRRLRLSL